MSIDQIKLSKADRDSIDRFMTQTRGQVFETPDRAFQTLGWAFSFLLNLQKIARVFQKLERVF